MRSTTRELRCSLTVAAPYRWPAADGWRQCAPMQMWNEIHLAKVHPFRTRPIRDRGTRTKRLRGQSTLWNMHFFSVPRIRKCSFAWTDPFELAGGIKQVEARPPRAAHIGLKV